MEKLSVLIDRLTQVFKDSGDIEVLTVNEDGLYDQGRNVEFQLRTITDKYTSSYSPKEYTVLFISV